MADCVWTSSTTPRVVAYRHGDLTGDTTHEATCKGCEPCREDHCACCGFRHVVELNCPWCIGATRTNLADIATLTDALPEQAITWAMAAIPGGTALVLAGPASTGISQQWAEECGEDVSHKVDEFGTPVPPLLLLATWAEAWSDVLGTDDLPRRATIESEVAWLSQHLHEVAQHRTFVEFAEEIRKARSDLESVLLDGNRPHVGKVRCLERDCTALLRQVYADPKPCTHPTEARRQLRVMLRENARLQIEGERWRHLGYPEGAPLLIPRATVRLAMRAARRPCLETGCDQGGRRDQWVCPACKREYDDQAYRMAKRQANDQRKPIRPGVEIARDLGISEASVRQWIKREQLTRHGRDSRGRVLLDVNEVRARAMQQGGLAS